LKAPKHFSLLSLQQYSVGTDKNESVGLSYHSNV